jgi:hypothetical protein
VCGSRVRILAKYGLWGYTLEEVTGRPEKTYDPQAFAAAANGAGGGAAIDGGRVPLNATDARRVRSAARAAERAVGLPAAVTLLVGLLGVVAGLWL